jgi:hypothetical protein
VLGALVCGGLDPPTHRFDTSKSFAGDSAVSEGISRRPKTDSNPCFDPRVSEFLPPMF